MSNRLWLPLWVALDAFLTLICLGVGALGFAFVLDGRLSGLIGVLVGVGLGAYMLVETFDDWREARSLP